MLGRRFYLAKIKTRELDKGSIKTIDRASIMTQHIKKVDLRIKDSTIHDEQSTEKTDTPDNYAQQEISSSSKAAAEKGAKAAYEVAKSAPSQIRGKKAAIEKAIKTKKEKDILLRNRQIQDQEIPNSSTIHSPKIKTPTEVEKKKAIYQKAMKDKAKRDIAARNSIRMKDAARKAARNAEKTAERMTRFVRSVIEATKYLITALGTLGMTTLVIVIMCVLFGAAFYFFGDDTGTCEPVSAEVEAYTPVIEKYAKEYGIPQYTELIKAVMMQESSGKGSDPMQASECKYNTKYPKRPNGIKNPEYSISCGVKYLRDNLELAKAKSPVGMDRIKLALQGYNYGSGYITWAVKKYGGYSYAGAVEFSELQAKKNGWKSYGDKDYVEHVLRYYPYGNYSYDVINTGPGKLALPIKGMRRGNISSHFGPRSSPGGFGSSYHEGLDIAFPTGTKVLSCETGTVVSAGWNGGYGKCIIIDHGGKLQTVYAHLSEIKVRTGQKVVRGQYIGNVGSTGNSTGPHLHLGVKLNGKFVNPEKGWLSIP